MRNFLSRRSLIKSVAAGSVAALGRIRLSPPRIPGSEGPACRLKAPILLRSALP